MAYGAESTGIVVTLDFVSSRWTLFQAVAIVVIPTRFAH